jgi:hypothetical protein
MKDPEAALPRRRLGSDADDTGYPNIVAADRGNRSRQHRSMPRGQERL